MTTLAVMVVKHKIIIETMMMIVTKKNMKKIVSMMTMKEGMSAGVSGFFVKSLKAPSETALCPDIKMSSSLPGQSYQCCWCPG